MSTDMLDAGLPALTHHVFYDEIDLEPVGDPLTTAARIAGAGLSDTYVVYEQHGEWSVALGDLAEIVVTNSQIRLSGPRGGCQETREWSGTPLPELADMLARLPVVGWRAYGWAGFDLAYVHAGRPDLVSADVLLHLVVPRTEVRLSAGRALARSVSPDELGALRAVLATPAPPVLHEVVPVDVRPAGSDAYRGAVAAAVREIGAGLLQKVVLSRVVPVGHPVDLVATYVVGRRRNNPSRSFLLRLGDLEASGFSPETVVEVDEGGRVRTQPLAGTRELVDADEENRSLRDDLLGDPKEIFEHAISVKLAYDELSELCVPGSVVVEDFMMVKERGTVQHLASSVAGQLPPGAGPWDAFRALFPAVTASGVPKAAAYASIHRHEAESRGLYSGAVLVVGEGGSLDAALVLRTIFQDSGRAWLRAGAGVVAQSTPDRELEETCEKLRSVALHIVRAPRT